MTDLPAKPAADPKFYAQHGGAFLGPRLAWAKACGMTKALGIRLFPPRFVYSLRRLHLRLFRLQFQYPCRLQYLRQYPLQFQKFVCLELLSMDGMQTFPCQ